MLCIGCKACTYACPISIPQMGRGLKIMVKCDMCGGDPDCIKVCSSKAIKIMSREQAEALVSEMNARPFVPATRPAAGANKA
jgi:Fe-S-cluster-containing dehydrogenase component